MRMPSIDAAGQGAVVAGECAAVGVHAEAGGGAGHVRAVAVAVERVVVGDRREGRGIVRTRVVVLAREVPAAHDLGGREDARGIGPVDRIVGGRSPDPTEVGVRVVDAGVDDADLDAVAEQAEVLPAPEHPSQYGGARIVDALRHDGGDRQDIGPSGQLADAVGVAHDGHAGHRVVGAIQLAGAPVIGAQLGDDGRRRPVGHGPGIPGSLPGCRVAGWQRLGERVNRCGLLELDEDGLSPGRLGDGAGQLGLDVLSRPSIGRRQARFECGVGGEGARRQGDDQERDEQAREQPASGPTM